MEAKNKLEYIRPELLEDLGFTRKDHDDLSWDHKNLLPLNLILVDYPVGGLKKRYERIAQTYAL